MDTPEIVTPTPARCPGEPVLEVQALSKRFGSTLALRELSFSFAAAEVTVVLGENGSGKSTLAKLLAGVHRPDAGAILRDGRSVSLRSPKDARRNGIAVAFQEPSLAPDLSVSDNLRSYVFADQRPWRRVHARAAPQETQYLLRQLGLKLDLAVPMRSLAREQQQLVEIARAVALRTPVLVLDEPTSGMTARSKALLLPILRKLSTAGTAVIYITHSLREALELGDRLLLLRDGAFAATFNRTERVTEDRLIAAMTGAPLRALAPRKMGQGAPPVLEVQCLAGAVCRNVSLQVRRGEVVGLYGLPGCGHEEVAHILTGREREFTGALHHRGRTYAPRGPHDARIQGVGLVPGDRRAAGFPHRSVRENLTLGATRQFAWTGLISKRAEDAFVRTALPRFRIDAAGPGAPFTTLSGGNQQKVILARALGAGSSLIVMEDATAGIDVAAKQEIYALLQANAQSGVAFLWLSSDMLETLKVCDRVYAMHGGRVTAELIGPTSADEELLLAAALGRGVVQTAEEASAA